MLVGVGPDIIVVGLVDGETAAAVPRLECGRNIAAMPVTGTTGVFETGSTANICPIPDLRDATSAAGADFRTTLAGPTIGVRLAAIEYATTGSITFRTNATVRAGDPIRPGGRAGVGITVFTGVGGVLLGMKCTNIIDQAVGKMAWV